MMGEALRAKVDAALDARGSQVEEEKKDEEPAPAADGSMDFEDLEDEEEVQVESRTATASMGLQKSFTIRKPT